MWDNKLLSLVEGLWIPDLLHFKLFLLDDDIT